MLGHRTAHGNAGDVGLRHALAQHQRAQLLGELGLAVLPLGQGRIVVAGQAVGEKLELVRQGLQHVPEVPIEAQAVN